MEMGGGGTKPVSYGGILVDYSTSSLYNYSPVARGLSRVNLAKEYMVKSHKMNSIWVPVRNSGGHIIPLFKKYS